MLPQSQQLNRRAHTRGRNAPLPPHRDHPTPLRLCHDAPPSLPLPRQRATTTSFRRETGRKRVTMSSQEMEKKGDGVPTGGGRLRSVPPARKRDALAGGAPGKNDAAAAVPTTTPPALQPRGDEKGTLLSISSHQAGCCRGLAVRPSAGQSAGRDLWSLDQEQYVVSWALSNRGENQSIRV